MPALDITSAILIAFLAALAVALLLVLVLARRAPPKVDLAQAAEHLLTLAEERLKRESQAGAAELDTKKQLIDQQLQSVKTELERVTNLVQAIEKDRESKFSSLATQLRAMGDQTLALTSSTNALREALSSSRARGQWGERMAEDILRLVGFIEGVNYRKQATLEKSGPRPDFEFFLPGGLRVNMDVKFPLDNYLRALEAPSDVERAGFERAFIRDVKGHIKALTTREYIDPEGGTLDYVLLFIPNESVYSYIHQLDGGVLEMGLQSRVICCSPLTLFAVLAVLRQAVENFNLQRASNEIVSLMGRFTTEWERFKGKMDDVGRRLDSAQAAYREAAGTRTRQLERPLQQIEGLLQGIPVAASSLPPPSVEAESVRVFPDDRDTGVLKDVPADPP